MPTFTKDEIQTALDDLEALWAHNATHWDNWHNYGDIFTEDVEYIEHNYGRFHSRQAVSDWLGKTMNEFPGCEMPIFTINWSMIDEQSGRVVAEVVNRMKDPGDGSIHQTLAIAIFIYGGNGLWKSEEDVYNPLEFIAMLRNYIHRCAELGTLSPQADAFAQTIGKGAA